MLTATPFVFLKPFIPRRMQLLIRRSLVKWKLAACRNIWPVDPQSGKPPVGWAGWPGGKKFALVLTHDVEGQKGHDACHLLAALEERLGLRSSFNFVAEDIKMSTDLIDQLKTKGFEVGLHGIHHVNQYKSRRGFQKTVPKINRYLKEWNAVGFRSPSMYHNLDMIHDLNIEYDSSTFDTDPFEPQSDGVGTIFPFWVPGRDGRSGYVEMPYTLPQDFLIFILMRHTNIDLWKKKLDWIASHGGMALFITHPDYMDFAKGRYGETYPTQHYEEFLTHIKTQYEGQYWHALPKDVASFWKSAYMFKPTSERKKIRVCMLAYSFYAFDARVRRYAEALASRGDHVDVLSLGAHGDKQHEVLNGVNVHRIQKRAKDEKNKFEYLYRMVSFLLNSGFHLAKKHHKSPYDLIHVHSVPDFEVFAAVVPKLLGAKIILDIHDPMPDFYVAKFGFRTNHYYKILSFIERVSTKFAHHVITVTDHWMKKIAQRSRIPERKISVTLNLPDIKMFNHRLYDIKGKENSRFILLYPGTINRHCGLDLAIKAINMAKLDTPLLQFHIYGGGTELEKLKQLANELNMQDAVFFHSPVPLESIPKIMQNADAGIALLAGQDEYAQQALNVKLFEYMSMGLPAIATRTKSIMYYIGEGTVMLSDPNSVEDIARCIIEMYSNPRKREELQERGLEFIRQNNSEIQMSNYLNIVDRLTTP
jgi:glycosyltransferase involved in cell wall biosynthesis/peptidoglycan/xylan/chitin deacetylase (PgdA/CDA1 family)